MTQKMTMHERVTAILGGDTPDRPPFIDRMEIWFKSKRRQNELPERFRDLSLNQIHRIPFQQALLEYLGEIPLFTAIYDQPRLLTRLIELLDQQLIEILQQLSGLDAVYVEFGDNLDGMMTNPNLFEKYALPYYQKYANLLHAQGKKAGSHTDGNLKPLLGLLAQSGLDVCESFSPAPLTECTFQEAWQQWQNGPIIWGGIPSPILEERTAEGEFREFMHQMLQIIDGRPIIVGVGDMVLDNNQIERVEYIAQAIENHHQE
jgi:uroporphyrinogen-III decarboxylase